MSSEFEDTFPDIGSTDDEQLRALIAELVNRLEVRRERGEAAISGADVQQLTDALTGKAAVAATEDEGS